MDEGGGLCRRDSIETLSLEPTPENIYMKNVQEENITGGRVALLVEAMENACAFWLLRSLYQRRRTNGGQRWRFPQPHSNRENGD